MQKSGEFCGIPVVTDVLWLNIGNKIHPHRSIMNTTNFSARNLMTLCACLVLGLSSTSLAQQATTSVGRPAETEGFDIAIIDGTFMYRGKETEATLENVLDVLRQRHPDANIVVAPEVPPILIKNLKIRATDLPMELEALRVASGDRFTWESSGGRQDDLPFGIPDAMLEQSRSMSEQLLYVLRQAPGRGQDRLRVEAFSLGGYFASLPKTQDADQNEALIEEKIEELKQMVDETVVIFHEISDRTYGGDRSSMTSLNMRFHRGANLVILIGDPQSIEIAGKVIGALPNARRAGGRMGYGGVFDTFDGRGDGFVVDPGRYGGGQSMGMPGGRVGGFDMRPVDPLLDGGGDPFGGIEGGPGLGGMSAPVPVLGDEPRLPPADSEPSRRR
jgi:hypothetical protein